MTCLGVVGPVAAHAGNRLICGYLAEQFRQHGGITRGVVGDLDGPDVQCVGINGQVHLAPLAPIVRSMLVALAFALTQELDAGAVDQQIQRGGAGSVGQFDAQVLLTPAYGTEIRNLPFQPGQAQQAFNHSQALAHGQAQEALDAQAELDGGIREDGLTAPFKPPSKQQHRPDLCSSARAARTGPRSNAPHHRTTDRPKNDCRG